MSNDTEYIYLDESAFEEEVMNCTESVIVEFGTDWCGSCRIMMPIVNDTAAAYRDRVKVIRLDIDRNKQLVARYGIRNKPTFLLIKNGEIAGQIIGPVSRKNFENYMRALLSNE